MDTPEGKLTTRDLQSYANDTEQYAMFATRGWQDFLVTLPTTPNMPFEISHVLSPALPTGIRYELLQATFPTVIYHDVDDLWGVDYIVLRATAGDGAQIRIRLTVDDGDTTPIATTTLAAGDRQGFQIDGAIGALAGGVVLGQISDSSVLDGTTGNGIRFSLASMYFRDDGADKYIKWSMDGVTPLQIRETAGDYFIQPGQDSTVGRNINLGSPIGGVFDKAYLFQVYSQGRSVAEGEWTDVAYAAGNFTASAGTWTVSSGNQAVYKYTLVGRKMTLAWIINSSSCSNAANMRLAIPGGFTPVTGQHCNIFSLSAGGARVSALAILTAAVAYVDIYATADAGNFAISASNLFTSGTITFQV